MKYTRTVDPTATPISLADARAWLAMETGVTVDDEVINELLYEANAYVEFRFNGRKLITQTWTVTLDEEDVSGEIKLRLLPLQSITSIKTYDDDGNENVVEPGDYHATIGKNPRVILKSSGSWGDLRWYDCMIIELKVGYGDAGSDIPYDLTLLMKGLVLHLYLSKGRGVAQTVSGTLIALPNIYDQMIKNYRLPPWA
jgi:uncharacterized phiE125 gp8 family phage protein